MTTGLNEEFSFSVLLNVRRKAWSMVIFGIPKINKMIETGIAYCNHIIVIAVTLSPRIRYYNVVYKYNLNYLFMHD